MTARSYHVTVRCDRDSKEYSEIVVAYDAQDAIAQTALKYRGCFPSRTVTKVVPACLEVTEYATTEERFGALGSV